MSTTPPAPGSVTNWVALLRQGDEGAARQLWRRYFPRLVALARGRLGGPPAATGDEEDVALSAFDHPCRAARGGGLDAVDGRDDLWRLLAALASRRATDHRRRQFARKRGGGGDQAARADHNPEDLAGREPAPDLAAQFAEEVGRLLGLLGDEELQALALWKLEGLTNEEIGARLGCVPRTVERRLRVIRSLWAAEVGDGGV
jgi:RNA polymerase sigma factor (sigma-70 family)